MINGVHTQKIYKLTKRIYKIKYCHNPDKSKLGTPFHTNPDPENKSQYKIYWKFYVLGVVTIKSSIPFLKTNKFSSHLMKNRNHFFFFIKNIYSG